MNQFDPLPSPFDQPALPIPAELPSDDDRVLHLRLARPEDAEAIWQLYHRVYQGTYSLPIVNLRAMREAALVDPNVLWLVVDPGQGELAASVIFQVDRHQRHAKVFAAVTDSPYRRANLAYQLIRAGIERLVIEEATCDVIYATTRTRSMGPDVLLRKLGFHSLGIFPNVHRTTQYETHGLKALFHPRAFASQRPAVRLIPEVAGFYEIVGKAYGLEEPIIEPIPDRLRLNVVRGDEVTTAYLKAKADGALLMDEFPFHPPTHLLTSPAGRVKAFLNHEGKDGHGALVALQVDREEVQHLEHIFDVVFENARGLGIDYLEVLISAHEPRHQRAALSARYLPCGYFPSMGVNAEGQRQDYLVFARSRLPLDFSNVKLTARDRQFLDVYLLNTEFRNLVVQMQEVEPDVVS